MNINIQNLNELGLNTTNVTGTSINLFQKEFETQSFYNSTTGLNLKSILIERFKPSCPGCNPEIPEGVIFRVCEQENCLSEVTNTTRYLNQEVYLFFSYEDPILNFNSSIKRVEIYKNLVYINQQDQDSNPACSSTFTRIGTNDAIMIKCQLQDSGSNLFKFQLYSTELDSTNTTVGSTTNIINNDETPKEVLITFNVLDPLSTEMGDIFNIYLMTIAGFGLYASCCISLAIFQIVKTVQGAEFREDSEDEELGHEIDDLRQIRNERDGFEMENIPNMSNMGSRMKNITQRLLVPDTYKTPFREESSRIQAGQSLPFSQSNQQSQQINNHNLQRGQSIPVETRTSYQYNEPLKRVQTEGEIKVVYEDGKRKVKRRVKRKKKKNIDQ